MPARQPQAAPYCPDPRISEVADFLGVPVKAADFPKTQLRFRNDVWDKAVGLGDMSDADWTKHFGRFVPLNDNLPQPLALKYHGHQFRNYNPDIGDGRGFLFAQLRDGGKEGAENGAKKDSGRLLDLGTKGSGQTPYSRFGDGRLTLKGGVREILATEMLEALGVNTSKTFSIIETGEELERNDEPSPTRSAVMVRLSHGHIRIGSFQRLMAHEEHDALARLVDYCLTVFPGPPPPQDAPDRDNPAIVLFHQVVERLADLAAGYMVAGFVHGVLNTDNMNITGESFDYGPWRWLPTWQPSFIAAYFDQTGLYAFGRQPEALRWNLGQLAIALRPLAQSEPLIAALDRFAPLYHAAMRRRFCWRLGVKERGDAADTALIETAERVMREDNIGPDALFFAHRGGRNTSGDLAEALKDHQPLPSDHPYWQSNAPETMLIDEVESLWAAIDERDDWEPLYAKIKALRAMGEAHGEPPALPGHTQPA